MMARALLVAAVVAASAPAVHADPPAGAVTPEQQKRAVELFEEGRELLTKQDPAGACQKFGQAIMLDPLAAGTMLNLGLCNEQLGKYKTALYWFRKAQRRATETDPPLPEHERAAKEHTAKLANLVGTIHIALAPGTPAGAIVKIDGELIQPVDYDQVEVDPGHHVLRAGAPGKRIVQQEFDLQGRGGQTLTLAFVDGDNVVVIDHARTRRLYGLGVGIGGIALLAGGGILLGIENSNYTGALAGARNGDPHDLKITRDAAFAARWYGTPLVAGGLVAAAVGAYLYFGAPAEERLQQTVFVPSVTPEGAGIAVSGRF